MITLNTHNTFKLPVRQNPVVSNKAQQHNQMELPNYRQNVGFGINFGAPIRKSYEEGISNCTLMCDWDFDEKYRVGDNVRVPKEVNTLYLIAGNNFNGEKGVNACTLVKAGDGFKAQSLRAFQVGLGNNADIKYEVISKFAFEAGANFKAGYFEGDDAKLGNNADIKGAAKAAFSFTAGDGFKVRSLEAGEAFLGNNADIKGEVDAYFGLTAGHGFKADSIVTRGDITLGSIERLNRIRMNKNTNDPPIMDRKLILKSENITPEKIKVYLGGMNSLEIQTPTGNADILDKFEFFTYSGEELPLAKKKYITVTPIHEKSEEKYVEPKRGLLD
ncbi:MAG: hypothetical protein A2Y25_03285 [Candidatus Melainabacteria bacterium GWF2_37_15]|nr:MAG: hypothetical protein A2Y25_03285 [Candidatus Melainabacteria bacterium GWF2_37_15]